jgi:hypothetical protein
MICSNPLPISCGVQLVWWGIEERVYADGCVEPNPDPFPRVQITNGSEIQMSRQ